MVIASITFNSSLVHLIEGLCSSNPGEFLFSGFRRNRTDDLWINSPSLWPSEPRLHVRSEINQRNAVFCGHSWQVSSWVDCRNCDLESWKPWGQCSYMEGAFKDRNMWTWRPPGRHKTFLLCCGLFSKETPDLCLVSTVAIPIFWGPESFQTKHFSVDTFVAL